MLTSNRRYAVLIFLLALMYAIVGCTSDEQPTVRNTSPVMLSSMDMIDSVLSANYGKWVLVNVWATWCRPCVAETPDLVAFTNVMFGETFAAFAISTDTFTDDDTTAVRKVTAFQEKYAIPYPNLVYKGSQDDLVNRFDLTGAVPTTILFDPQGHVKHQFVGMLKQPQFTAIENYVR